MIATIPLDFDTRAAMEPWEAYAEWSNCPSELRAWAELEGKSATMREDLYRSVASRLAPKRNSLTAPAFLMHVAIVVLDVLRMLRSG